MASPGWGQLASGRRSGTWRVNSYFSWSFQYSHHPGFALLALPCVPWPPCHLCPSLWGFCNFTLCSKIGWTPCLTLCKASKIIMNNWFMERKLITGKLYMVISVVAFAHQQPEPWHGPIYFAEHPVGTCLQSCKVSQTSKLHLDILVTQLFSKKMVKGTWKWGLYPTSIA